MITRKLEIIGATGARSRLTITPSRVTIKIHVDEENPEKLIRAGLAIADSVTYHLSLRGLFDEEREVVELSTDTNKSNKRIIFVYNFKGELQTQNNI